jgi:hypothetical protein
MQMRMCCIVSADEIPSLEEEVASSSSCLLCELSDLFA